MAAHKAYLTNFLPDDLGSTKDVDIALDADQGWLNALLDWLFIGRVPLLVWLIIFLTLYSLSGFILQSILQTWTGKLLECMDHGTSLPRTFDAYDSLQRHARLLKFCHKMKPQQFTVKS